MNRFVKLLQFLIIFPSFCIASCTNSSTPKKEDPDPEPVNPDPEPHIDPDPEPTPYDYLWDHNQDRLRTGVKTLNFYNLNDTHGSVDYTGTDPGIAKLTTYLNNEKAKDPDSFVFTSSGDMWQGSADSNLTKGKIMVDWMNYVGCSAQALGNHEFDWTIDVIKENTKTTNFDYLGCNIIYKDSKEHVDFAKPYTTTTVNGIRIGIIGAIMQGITSSILSKNVENIVFDNPDKYVKEYSTYLRENGADFILYLYHGSTYTISDGLASYIDGAFGGHNHSTEYTTLNDTIPCVEGGCNGRYVSHINVSFNFDTADITYGDCDYEKVNLNLSDDQIALNIRASFAGKINEIKNKQIANLPNQIANDDLILYAEKCMYKFYKEELKGDKPVYRVSHNQARSPKRLDKGIVTYGDIYQVFPFDNTVCLTTVEYRYAKDQYVSLYPLGNAITDDMKNTDGRIFVLSIDYLVTSETSKKYYNMIEEFTGVYVRDLIAKYLAIEFPVN